LVGRIRPEIVTAAVRAPTGAILGLIFNPHFTV